MTATLNDAPPVYHLPGECPAGHPWCVTHTTYPSGDMIHEADVTGIVVADHRTKRTDSAGAWVSTGDGAPADPTVNLGVRFGESMLRRLKFSPDAARWLARALDEAASIATNSCPAGRLEVGDFITVDGKVQMVVALLHDLWCCECDVCPGEVQIFTDVSEREHPDTPVLHVPIDRMVQLGSTPAVAPAIRPAVGLVHLEVTP